MKLKIHPILSTWALGLAMLMQFGCGYSTKELYPEQYRTMAVPIFANNSYYRELQYELAEALTKQVEQRTPYKVGSPATADTILQGTITQVRQELVTRSRLGAVPEELELTITVDFQWKDLRTAASIVDRKGFTAVGSYVPARGVGQPIEQARHQAVQRLAEDIVSQLRAQW